MKDLAFRFEWEDPAGAKGAELRATWAPLKIMVGSDLVTELFDRHSRSEREQLFLPLYPLAEWIAEHWWHLMSEPLSPGKSTSDSYDKRHNLLSSSEGFALPSLLIQPHGGTVLLTWNDFRFQNSPIRFLSSGEGQANLHQVEHELRGLVDAVVERLLAEGITNTYLQQEWEAINSADKDEAEFCIAAASLGLDPYGVPAETAASIESAASKIPIELSEEFFSVVEAKSLDKDVEQLSLSIDHAHETPVSSILAQMRSELRTDDIRESVPWLAGYEAARSLRKLLTQQTVLQPSLEALANLFGITLAGSKTQARKSEWLEALARVSNNQTFEFFLPRMHEHKARFALCRVMYEYLTASENSWRMVTPSRTDIQAQNRAFASEFLVPAELLASRLPSSVLDQEEVEDLAFEFGVSSWIVRYQLENHRLGHVIT